MHPCLTRVMMSKSSETTLLNLTQVELQFRASDILMYLGSTPYDWTICHSDSLWMLLKAFLKFLALFYDVPKHEDLFRRRTFPSKGKLVLL